MDALVEFLFKYRPVVFEGAHLAFGASWLRVIVVTLLGIAALAAIITYIQVKVRGNQGDRRILIGMRVALLLLLVFVLLRPMLVVSAAVGRRNVVGVLVDDSRSMQVKDMDGKPRAEVIRSLFGSVDSSLYKALDERFTVRFFHVGGNGAGVKGVQELQFDGAQTRLAASLEGARQELSGAPLSGLILVSDGADNAPAGKLTETLLSLKARKVPIYTVGLGQERFAKDIEVSRVEAPRSVLKGASVIMNVDVAQRGFGGTTVQVAVEDSGKIVGMENVTLPKDGEATTVRVRVPTTTSGAHVYTVRATTQPDEMVTENNAQTVMVVVKDRRDKILYVEGEPRNELKFLRQALDEDENLQLVTLMRTAKDRFLRLGVDDSLELVNGFPTKREELFAYRAIVLGSIEASFFTVDQLRMISDFVAERGGGFLMLGGRKSFAEGGYAKTPIADVLPVELPKQLETPVFQEVKVDLTPTGSIYPLTQIGVSESASVKRWKTLPAVSTVNRILGPKPGAGTLLVGTAPKGGKGQKEKIVLAYQRYGQGTAFAFPIQDSWFWKMHADIPLEDETYKSFWRQVLRALVNDAPGRVTVATSGDLAGNEPLRINADVFDKAYAKVNGAKVSATVLAPSGSVSEVPLEWTGIRDGEYHTSFVPKEQGVHSIRVTSAAGADTVLSDPAFINVGTPASEFFGAEQRAALLKRVAEETGGQYYTPANALNIAKDLVYSKSGTVAPERLDLWDMPILFMLLIALMAGEWLYRRGRGLV